MNPDHATPIPLKMSGSRRILSVVVVRHCASCRECYEGLDGISRRSASVWAQSQGIRGGAQWLRRIAQGVHSILRNG